MARVLIVCSTTDGQTGRICARVQQILVQAGDTVQLVMVEQAAAIDPLAFDRVVIGARIRYGHHHPLVHAFVARHRQALQTRPSAFFSVNIVARKPDKNRPKNNPYVRKFLRRSGWQPALVGVFAGKLDYPRYGPLDRLMIRFIMWMTHGPTQPDAVVEFTDWGAVEAFAQQVHALGAH